MHRSPWHCFEFYLCLLAEGSPSPGAECGVLLQRFEAERLSKEKQLSVQTLQERHPGCAAAFAGRGCLQQDMTLPSLIQAPCNGLPYPPSAAGEGKAAARCLQAWCAEDSSSGLPDCINALNPMRSRRHCRWTLKCQCHNGLAVWTQCEPTMISTSFCVRVWQGLEGVESRVQPMIPFREWTCWPAQALS